MWRVDMRSVVLRVQDCLCMLLDASVAITADADSDSTSTQPCAWDDVIIIHSFTFTQFMAQFMIMPVDGTCGVKD